MQEDGNLVLNYQQALWASNTAGHDGATCRFDSGFGFLSIYDKDNNLIWYVGGGIAEKGRYFLNMQQDGNLVIYEKPIWATNTFGHDGATYQFQDDGNLVVLDKDGHTVLWASNTGGHTAYSCRLDMQQDGNLVIYQNLGNYPIVLMQSHTNYTAYNPWLMTGIGCGWETNLSAEWLFTPDGKYYIYRSGRNNFRVCICN